MKFINPLLESTVTVLSTMAMIDAKPGKPSKKDSNVALGDVTGMIDLTGPQAKGSLAISFSEAAILDITQKMLGEEIDNIDETVVDVVGEVTNMITGNAKRLYSEQGIELDLTLPNTLIGKNQIIQHSIDVSPIVLPFQTQAGQFYVELCFQ